MPEKENKQSLEDLLKSAANIARDSKPKNETRSINFKNVEAGSEEENAMKKFAEKYALMLFCPDGKKCEINGCTPDCLRGLKRKRS